MSNVTFAVGDRLANVMVATTPSPGGARSDSATVPYQ